MTTKAEAAAGTVRALAALAEAIRYLGSIPAGHLYAHTCGAWSLDTFQALLGVLKRSGLVSEDGFHVLTWTGPTIPKEATT